MTKEDQITIDLLALRKILPEKYKKARGAIYQLNSARSIFEDLNSAINCIFALDKLEDGLSDKSHPYDPASMKSAQSSLIQASILVYTRATKTSSAHRGTINFIEKFSDIQRLRHKEICNLRDKSIAHFGPGKLVGTLNIQNDDLLMIIRSNPFPQFLPVTRRLLSEPNFENMLQTQYFAALFVAMKETYLRFEFLNQTLTPLARENEFIDLALQCQTSLEDTLSAPSDMCDEILKNSLSPHLPMTTTYF